jgi:hypothetical protein
MVQISIDLDEPLFQGLEALAERIKRRSRR